MADYLEKALREKQPAKKLKQTLYWDEATALAVKEFCIHHRGWNTSRFAEVAVLEKLEREKVQPEKKPDDLLMRHTTKET